MMRILPFAVALLLVVHPAAQSMDLAISVFAGNGADEWTGIGSSATATAVISPNGLGIDSSSRVLIAEGETNQIFRVDPQGKMEVIAGCGFSGFAGDGGPATDAFLTKPYGILAESSGTFLISDQWNHRIRRVGTDGIIKTIAGNGEGFFGLGAYSGDGGAALSGGFNFPSGLARGSDGSLFIADQMNGRVRRVDPDGKLSTFVGPTGRVKLPLKRPIDLHMDSRDNLLIVDAGTNQIYSASSSGSAEILIGPPISETMIPKHPGIYLNFPVAVEISPDGTIYWAENKNNRVCRLLPGKKEMEVLMEGAKSPGIRLQVAGREPEDRPKLGRPSDLLLLPDGSLLVADPENHLVWKISLPPDKEEDQS
jgi:sugar lactone lactonase YvrE